MSPRRLATRRHMLVLGCFFVLVAVAVAANYGPLERYQAAKQRLTEAAAGVGALEKQKAELQAQLSRLGQARYLEGLAREELSYARPGEDLYIVTGVTGDPLQTDVLPAEAAAAIGVGGSGLAASGSGADAGANDGSSTKPGPLERALSAISRLF